jgi:adenylate cyclase
MGFSDGTMFQARTLTGLSSFQSPNKGKLPTYAKFALRTINKQENSDNLTETWTYLNDDFSTIDSEALPKAKYNVTKLDWYVKTELSKEKCWSDVYIFKSSQLAGITLSMPLGYYDNLNAIGIIAVDCAVEHFKDILESAKGSPNSVAYLLNKKNEIIISSNMEEENAITQQEDGRSVNLINVNDSNNPVLEKAILTMLGNEAEHVVFSVNGAQYIASIQKLKKIDCSLLTIAPENDFIGEINNVQRDMMLISLFVYLLSFIIVWLSSRRISNPINALCKSAKAIETMDLENYPLPPKSSIVEIQKLSNIMNSMHLSVSTFSKYAPKDLVMRLVKTGKIPVLGGKVSNITMLFSDIEKFSTISEKLPAEYLILHLSEYFDELTKEIMNHNGVIDKYIGDSIMALWGAPNPDENQIENACHAALKCQELLEKLKDKWLPLGKPPLPTRIGIHTGVVIVGNIGSRDRMSFTAIGDTVNIASRLEGANKYYGTKILVSESVESATKGRFLFRVIDRIAVKGKSVGITIYEPLCAMKDADEQAYYQQLNLCAKSKEAFEAYQNQEFAEALELYNRILETFPEIELSITSIIKNCKEFIKNPPVNWDGVNHLSSK